MKLLLFLLLLLLIGCAESEFEQCILESNAYGEGFIDALADIEEHLLEQGILSAKSPEGYRRLLAAIEQDAPMPRLDSYCEGDPDCWRLLTPASTAAYIGCAKQVDEHPPLREAAQWAEENGDIGPRYLRRVLDALDESRFDKMLYRAAFVQPLAVLMLSESAGS